MQKLFRKLKSQRPGYDNKKYSIFFVQIINVRNYFKIKNYKACKALFELFDQQL